ncbi:MAG TPA: hypothetical protein VGT40_10040 [Methylomirabilota bacterium]|nr:hypothetical protein [Methylomirabilota bacterium]
MTHPLSGFVSVEESAELVRNYRYAVERMMRTLGGWIALTPELSAKLLMGRHVWDNAQHADALGRRLPELRALAHVSAPANQAFVAFMDAVEEPERPHQTLERLTGIYGVVKPHLMAAYLEHLRVANTVYEPPTQRILARCVEDERRHIAAGLVVLGHLVTTPALEERANAWRARLEPLLAASGGVTGRGLPPLASVDPVAPAPSLSDDAREFIRFEQPETRWTVPADLESAVRALGDALTARDAGGLSGWLLPGATLGEGVEAALAAGQVTGHRMVSLAKIGRQRLIKLRLQGPGGSVVLSTRWTPADGGWRVAVLDLAALEPQSRA